MRIVAHGTPQVWIDGKPLKVQAVKDTASAAREHEGATVYRAAAAGQEVLNRRSSATAPRRRLVAGPAQDTVFDQ